MAKSKSNNAHICAILAWIFPIGLIWFLLDSKMNKDKLVKFHIKQSLVLVVLALIVNFAGSAVPFFGRSIILPVGEVVVLILFIIGLVHAFKKEQKELPIIGQFARRF